MRTRRSHYDANAERLETKRRELKDKQFRKTHEDGNSYFSEADVRPDPYHSSDTPCCRLGLQVLEKLFPEIDELGVVEKKAEGEAEAGATDDAAAATASAARGDASASAVTSDKSASEQSKKTGPSKGADGRENTNTGGQGGEQAMELMALLIRTHLLEERKRARGDGGSSSSGGGGGNGGGKKKKKKKKRKKGPGAGTGTGTGTDADADADAEAAATPVEAAASTAAPVEANGQGSSVVSAAASLEDDEGGNFVGGVGAVDDGAGSGILEASTMVAASSSSPSGVAQLNVSSSSSPPKSATAKEDGNLGDPLAMANGSSAQSPLDCFLDQILQSTAGGKGREDLPANRDLASFVKFLNARYRIYLNQKQEQSSGSGVRKKKADHHQRTFDSMEVLPTISFRVLERQAENPVCSKCRTGSTTKVYSSSHEGTEQVTHSFTITDDSTAWPPNEGTARLQEIEALIHSDDGIEMTRALDYVALEEGHGGGFVEEGGYSGGGDSTNPDRKRFRIKLEGSVPLKSSALRDIRHYEGRHPSLQRERPEFLTIIPPQTPDGESPQVLSLSDIVRLVTHVLVPGTLDLANWVGGAPNGVDGVNEDVYSIKEYRSVIESRAKIYYESGTKKLNELEALRDKIVDEGSKVRTMQENSFRPNEAKCLRLAESICDSYLEKANVLLEKFSQMSLGVCCEDTPLGKWARGVIQEITDKIDMAYSESVVDVTTYQRKIGERFRNVLPGSRPSCDNFGIQGAVPEYRDMVNKKIGAISMVQSALEEKLLSQSSIHPNLTGMQCFCAASIYYAFPDEITAAEGDQDAVQGSRGTAATSIIETVAEKVREERQTMCCTSWREVTFKENLLEHKRQATIVCGNELDLFEVQLDNANIYVNDVGIDANAFTSIITRLTKYEMAMDYRTRTCQEENDSDWFAESAEDVVGHHNRRATDLLLKWWLLRLRRFKKSQIAGFESMPNAKQRLNNLPRRYVRWVEKTFSAENVGKAEDSDPCPGYGRDRRVACLIAAMLYGWLQDRCVEWNAELRQKEVLAAMENDEQFFANDPSPLEKESGKSSKKKKKKGKKKATPGGAGASTGPETIASTDSTDANAVPEDKIQGVEKNDHPTPNEEEKDASRDEEEIPTSNLSPKQKVAGGFEAEITDQPCADIGEDFISVAGAKKAKSKKKKNKNRDKSAAATGETSAGKSVPIQDEDGVEVEVGQVDEMDSNALRPDYVSKVTVQDGKELIPVEYFLVRRLRIIMSQAKTNASVEPDAKRSGEKIVFL